MADERFRTELGDPLVMTQRLEQLTPKETEVFDGIFHGRSNKQIAGTLNVSVRTVETHRANLTRKLGVRSTADLVRLALAFQLFT